MLLAGVTASWSATAANWPQWRGPNRDGAVPESPALSEAWPAGGPPLVWSSEPITGGEQGGYASPVVCDGRVYVHSLLLPAEPRRMPGARTAADDAPEKPESGNAPGAKPAEALVYCLDAATGKTVWKKSYPSRKSAYGASSPCVANGKMYVMLGGCGVALCLNAGDGKELWKTNVLRECASSFLVSGDTAFILGYDLVALDVETGVVKWRAAKSNSAEKGCPSVMSRKKGDRQELICVSSCEVAAKAKLLDVSKNVSPVIADGRVFVRGNKAIYCLDLRKDK